MNENGSRSLAGGTLPAGQESSPPRGRPGRRSVEERQKAVLELLSGKATVDQLAHRFGVHASTVEGWREDALAGIAEALKRGTGRSVRELELERENADLRDAVASAVVKVELLQREAGVRPGPTRPARSRR